MNDRTEQLVRLTAIEEQIHELATLTGRITKAMLEGNDLAEQMVEVLELALGTPRPPVPRVRHLHIVKPPAV